ncbi:uncharacterized protein LOC142322755 [Lycorma delicatula]|uniref:uncharacterized protein LOC142322755 n=1 Tax=Lycorma delicatula TaxID=130591 RepID=UPI003F519B83
MQQLWLLKIGWDDPLPAQLQQSWKNFVNEVPELQLLRVPRKLFPAVTTDIEIYGFCNTSDLAYGACIYIRSNSSELGINITLLCAKSRVELIRKVSIPRLELCAALLLAQLVNQIVTALKLHCSEIVMWSDSTVTLVWILIESSVEKIHS